MDAEIAKRLDELQERVSAWAERPIDESRPQTCRFLERYEDVSVEIFMPTSTETSARGWWACSLWVLNHTGWASGDDPEQAFRFARNILEREIAR